MDLKAKNIHVHIINTQHCNRLLCSMFSVFLQTGNRAQNKKSSQFSPGKHVRWFVFSSFWCKLEVSQYHFHYRTIIAQRMNSNNIIMFIELLNKTIKMLSVQNCTEITITLHIGGHTYELINYSDGFNVLSYEVGEWFSGSFTLTCTCHACLPACLPHSLLFSPLFAGMNQWFYLASVMLHSKKHQREYMIQHIAMISTQLKP